MADRTDQLIEQARIARNESRGKDARRDLESAIAIARGSGDHATLLRALKALGHVVWDDGNLDDALALYEEALELARAGRDHATIAHTVRHVGQLHLESGRGGDAERCLREAVEIYRSIDDACALDMANALWPYSTLVERSGETDAARALLIEARDLYAEVGVSQGVDECEARLRALESRP